MVKSRRRAASSTLIDGSPAIVEALVPASGLRFPPWQRDVDVAELEHLEALAHELDSSERFEQLAQPGRRDAEDLDVDVFRLTAEQPVADPAADDERASAFAANGFGDLSGQHEKIVD